ncbi:MAG: efflux RND transporter periplasmic adaptor subunit [Bacteroidales bacterium]|nr:efflux RND transporter periplasmic adaptor subunit [Bacteroidales bacterium]
MKKKSKKKKWFIGGGIFIIVIILLIVMSKNNGSESIKVTTEFAKKRTIIETVSANGKIQPETDIKISPYISGEVIQLNVKEGDKVAKGQLLAKIDPEIYKTTYERMNAQVNSQKANLANSRARLAQVEAQYKKSQLDFQRNKKLWNEKVISDAEFEAVTSSFEVAKAEVKAAKQSVIAAEHQVSSSEASLNEAYENLTKTSVIAPNDGTVSKLNIEEGERVTGASQFSSGTEIMRVADLSKMEVNVEVNENDIVRVNLGDTSIIEVDAYLNKDFTGVVTEIATSADIIGTSVDQVTNFDVKIRILSDSYKDMIPSENPDFSPFRPGMSATVEIQTETAHSILTVPIQAVTTRSDTSSNNESKDTKLDEDTDNNDSENEVTPKDEEIIEYVFIYVDGVAKIKKVETGIQNSTYIEISEGLTEYEEVITGPYRAVSKRLKNDDAVKKVKRKYLFTKDD